MNVLDLLSDLVKIDSSTQEGANQAIDYCEGWLRGQNLRTKKFEIDGAKMLLAEIGEGEKTIVLNGHVDVVPGKSEQFSPLMKNGKMYGRGTADMKAGVAAMMWVMTLLEKEQLHCKIMLQIVSDEETGSNCSRYLSDEGYRGDFVICGEPTQLGIGLQSKGVLYLDLIVKGKPAHGSRPWEGENAIIKAFHQYEKITQLPFASESSDMYEFPSIDLPIIEGGTVMNQVPDVCKISINIRFLPEQSHEEIIKQIESVVDGKIVITGMGEAIATKKNDPYVQALESACVKMKPEKDINVFGQHGSSDGKHFAKYGIPAVEFGPSGSDWHGDQENVILQSVDDYIDILIELAKSMERT
ncbi:M20 family metallopeptidase [Lederbergia lenta]|uniref:M20 family metallopeptidase n=1 Tax=Lederbergia lenta TaxID=1467 RepID=UPI0020422E26|nr:ArgE/DapE family deacylase [Lederbergia lenta]MCM3112120.1 ArgE/DapE family deacylase [Lederbergia lenta]